VQLLLLLRTLAEAAVFPHESCGTPFFVWYCEGLRWVSVEVDMFVMLQLKLGFGWRSNVVFEKIGLSLFPAPPNFELRFF
jgi:hypothetical protein